MGLLAYGKAVTLSYRGLHTSLQIIVSNAYIKQMFELVNKNRLALPFLGRMVGTPHRAIDSGQQCYGLDLGVDLLAGDQLEYVRRASGNAGEDRHAASRESHHDLCWALRDELL